MRMPRFTADTSLYRTTKTYRQEARRTGSRGVSPALMRVGGLGATDVICDTYCCAVCSCCANKGDLLCCNNCGASCPKAFGGGGTLVQL